MARGRRGKQNKNKNTEKGEKNNGEWTKNHLSYDTIVKENELFEKYYRQLNLMDEKEFDIFMNVLKQPLPITFRITSYKSYSKEILKILKEKHFKYIDEITSQNLELVKSGSSKSAAGSLIQNQTKEESNEDIYKCLEWYPGEMAWQVALSRQDVRKNVHFREFKDFLIHQTTNGNLNRQEAVSMIPPLLLDVKPHHKILDMCASPGSKTAQLIEFLHQDKSNPTPEGFVIANDLENKRCYMLMHQLKRLESPNFMIINHDASSLPNFRINVNEDKFTNIMYDRILADVPCSGDGTFRKNIDVWTKWNFAHACNLHGIQSRIANRAAELLKPGGLMVYSTCSLNPVENEAVVCNLLLKFKGKLELVDARHKLPGLKTVNGLLTWNLMNKKGEIYETSEQVINTEYKNLIKPYMFPPELSLAKELNLDRCIRILPHHQNTGGFFIAVIRKLPTIQKEEELCSQKEDTENSNPAKLDDEMPPEEDKTRVMKAPPAKRLKHVYEENPFQFHDINNKLLNDWPKIKEFFQISDEFPVSQMMTRNKKGENVRNVYFVSKEIKELTMNNGDRFKFINMGVPLFSRAELKDSSQLEIRIYQESVDIVQKYFKRRIVIIKHLSDLTKILTESIPSLNEFSADFQEQINTQCQNQLGSLILIWQSQALTTIEKDLPISFTAWLGKTTLRPFVNIDARRFFLTIIGVELNIIDKACEKIKQEDQLNSKKSMEKNPQCQSKILKQAESSVKLEEENKEKIESDDSESNDLLEKLSAPE